MSTELKKPETNARTLLALLILGLIALGFYVWNDVSHGHTYQATHPSAPISGNRVPTEVEKTEARTMGDGATFARALIEAAFLPEAGVTASVIYALPEQHLYGCALSGRQATTQAQADTINKACFIAVQQMQAKIAVANIPN